MKKRIRKNPDSKRSVNYGSNSKQPKPIKVAIPKELPPTAKRIYRKNDRSNNTSSLACYTRILVVCVVIAFISVGSMQLYRWITAPAPGILSGSLITKGEISTHYDTKREESMSPACG